MSGDYEIGYGKPPKSGQWAPGQSGNPSGSSKKVRERARKERERKQTKSFGEMAVEELCETIAPHIDGEKQETLVARVIAKALVRDALGSRPVDRREAIKLLDKLGAFDLLKEKSAEAELMEDYLSKEELRMIEALEKLEWADHLPDKGEGWCSVYDLEPYVTDCGQTEYRIVPLAGKKPVGSTKSQDASRGVEEEFYGR